MALLTILSGLVVVASLGALLKGHYIFAFGLILVAAYELTAPVLIMLSGEDVARYAPLIFTEYASEGLITSVIAGLCVFFAMFIATYLVATYFDSAGEAFARFHHQQHDATLFGFAVVLLLFGVVSMWSGAGRMRLEDYGELGPQSTEYSRFFSYGGLLLVVVTGAALRWTTTRHVWIGLAALLCAMPLVMELFVAGRRQWFLPSFLLVVLSILYGHVKRKALWTFVLASAVAVVFALQFSLREVAIQGATTLETESLGYAVLAPQATEFVFVGATTLYAWSFFADGDQSLTFGFQWLYQALNAIPFLRLGDLLFPGYHDTVYGIYNLVAPWGGLSMLADSLIAFGAWGLPLAAVVLGMFCRWAHVYLSRALVESMPPGLGGMYVVSLIATLLMKYRSGFGDAVQTVISFSILYWAIALAVHIFVTLGAGLSRQDLRRESGSDR